MSKLTNDEKIAKIATMKLGELQFRRKLINMAIRDNLQAGSSLEVVEAYRAQMGRIDDEIKKRKTGYKAPDTIINAKPAKVGAKGQGV